MRKTYNLWARIGVSVNVSEENKEQFLQDPEKYIEDNLLNKEIVEMDDDTYFPSNAGDNDLLGIGE